MALSLLFLPLLLAQEKAASAPAADKPVPAAIVPAEQPPVVGPPVKAAAKTKTGKPAAPAEPAPQDNGLGLIVWVPALFLVLYVFMIRPQRKQEARLRDLLNNLKKGDKVQTAAGIFGTVVSTDPESEKVVLRVDDDKGIKLTFSKASIVRVIEPQPEKAAETTSS